MGKVCFCLSSNLGAVIISVFNAAWFDDADY